MNPLLKGILFLALAGGLVAYAMDDKIGKEQEKLQQSLTDFSSRLRILDKETETVRQRRARLQNEVGTVADLDKQNNENMVAIPEERKKADELLLKWKAADQERAAAVMAVRENEKKLPPHSLTLKDNSKLEQFILRSVGEDDVLTVEHANGLMKLPADKLTPEYAEHLGIGWKPVPPAAPELKPQEKVMISVAQQAAEKKMSPEEKNAIKQIEKLTASEQLSKVEAELLKTQSDFEAAKQDMRALDIRKSDAKVKGGTGQTYGDLKIAAGAKVSTLAKRVVFLQSQRRSLVKQVEGIKTDGY